MKRRLICLIQNRLGALDRVMGTLSHQGYVPDYFESRAAARSGDMKPCLRVSIQVHCPDEKRLVKLLKAIERQVTTLEVTVEAVDDAPFAAAG
ncbi:MAG: hypothetical protein IPK79_09860 [Vampirovibrionales bacterium]|nr:hypothetical protein [Vampirovibrionales bacterium]